MWSGGIYHNTMQSRNKRAEYMLTKQLWKYSRKGKKLIF